MAPGIIKTPLWTEHPEKLSLFDEVKDVWVEPEEVAEAMLRCLEDVEVGGGWVLEVTKGMSRNVLPFNSPPPQGPGGGISNGAVNVAEIFSWLGEEGWGIVKK